VTGLILKYHKKDLVFAIYNETILRLSYKEPYCPGEVIKTKMFGIPIERIGYTYQLSQDLESQGPDLSCYCERCAFKKKNEIRVSNVCLSILQKWHIKDFCY